jgi:hypothetical protein
MYTWKVMFKLSRAWDIDFSIASILSLYHSVLMLILRQSKTACQSFTFRPSSSSINSTESHKHWLFASTRFSNSVRLVFGADGAGKEAWRLILRLLRECNTSCRSFCSFRTPVSDARYSAALLRTFIPNSITCITLQATEKALRGSRTIVATDHTRGKGKAGLCIVWPHRVNRRPMMYEIAELEFQCHVIVFS